MPRKACDLCYRKKIKCDSKKPRCATCTSYDCDCTFAAASRKAPKRKTYTAKHQADVDIDFSDIEERLEAALNKVASFERRAASQRDLQTSAVRIVSNGVDLPMHHELPQLEETLRGVERYLATVNLVYPIFCSVVLLQDVRRWYARPGQQDIETWAVINVVLALAHLTKHSAATIYGQPTVGYIRDVQSTLSAIVQGGSELVGIQVPLALALYFWATDDERQAMTVLATAIRLLQYNGYHDRSCQAGNATEEASQRNKVFWVAYILDREISIRARVAPLLQDPDIDVALPPYKLESASLHVKMFLLRIELAQIQGKVYGALHSASARGLMPEESADRKMAITHALDTWSIWLSLLHPDPSRIAGCEWATENLLTLLAGRLLCRALNHYGCVSDTFHTSGWVSEIGAYGFAVTARSPVYEKPLTPGWEVLVEEAREYMKLFDAMGPKSLFLISMTSCAYLCGLVVILCNKIITASTVDMADDTQLADQGLGFLGALIDAVAVSTRSKLPELRELRVALVELASYGSFTSSLM